MGDIIIKITASDPKTGKLTMSDQGTTNVIQGDQVTWEIEPNSGVAAITKISEKPMSFDLFKPDPKQLPNSINWQGTINPDIGSDQEETYYIEWTTAGTGWLGKDGAGQHKKFDPIIRIKPKQI
ncbi:hypothetical protein [Muriicola sp.]|uniref:hypothetical protein n=1 Tax=Muriicola sp. TaxID=2020856 RepID=UPI003C718C68